MRKFRSGSAHEERPNLRFDKSGRSLYLLGPLVAQAGVAETIVFWTSHPDIVEIFVGWIKAVPVEVEVI